MSIAPRENILWTPTRTIVLTVLLSVVGVTKGATKELLFPIVTHVGAYDSRMVVLNPSEFSVTCRISGRRESGGGATLTATMSPNSMLSFGANSGINPSEFRGGWGVVKCGGISGVPDADMGRGALPLLAWTELTLLGPNEEWPTDPQNSVIAVASIPAVEPALEFSVPGVFRKDQETAIAILNPSEEPIQIDVTLYHYRDPVSDTPYIQVTNTLSVPPMQRLSRFLGELMSEGQDKPLEVPWSWTSSRITLHIRGSAPIAVGALLYYRNGLFGNLPVLRMD